MADMTQYDAIVIGTGQSGRPLAMSLQQSGRRTAIIEREYIGGTCVNVGCAPTKTMVASARVAYLARRGADYGIQTGAISVRMPTVLQRKRAIVERSRQRIQRRLEDTQGLDLLMGEATFVGPKKLEVRLKSGEVRNLSAPTIVINTGERPTAPPPILAAIPTLNSTTIMELNYVPAHLVVVGGGYIALEFAQMFRRFGSLVTIVQRSGRLLSQEDEDVSAGIEHILREDGVDVLTGSTVVRAEPGAYHGAGHWSWRWRQHPAESGAQGGARLHVRTPDGERALDASDVLVAIGRTPNTDTLNPGAAGIQISERGYIEVNDQLETNVDGIYATGDVTGEPAFAHISLDDFRILRKNLTEHGHASRTGRLLIFTIFTDPQLGRVGLSERQAREQGRAVRVAKLPMNMVARAMEVDEPRGFMKALVDPQTGELVGAAVLGIEGGELMAMLEIAMLGHLPYTVLRDAVFAHPTLAESLNFLFSTLDM